MMLRRGKVLVLLLLFTLLISLVPAGHSNAASNWNQVWSDEFDGNSLNTGNWSAEVNGDGGGNNELQYYTNRAQNLNVIGGISSLLHSKNPMAERITPLQG